MYSFRNLFTKSPVQIAGGVVGLLNVLVLTGALDWSGDTIAGVNIGLALVLGLFVGATTVNAAKLQELQASSDELEAHTLNAIQLGKDLKALETPAKAATNKPTRTRKAAASDNF